MGKKTPYTKIDKQIYKKLSIDKKLFKEDIQEEFDLTTKQIDHSIDRLEEKDQVMVNRVMSESRWKIQIQFIEEDLTDQTKSNIMVWETHNNLPCFTCPAIRKCSIGITAGKGDGIDAEITNPNYCEYLATWMKANIAGEKYTNPFLDKYFKFVTLKRQS